MILFVIFLILYAYLIHYLGKFTIALKFKRNKTRLIAPLKYYGYFVLTLSYTIAFIIFFGLLLLYKFNLLISTLDQLLIANVINFLIVSLFLIYWVDPKLDVRNYFERNVKFIMLCISSLSFVITILIIISILFETYKFFSVVSLVDFFTSINWNPQDHLEDIDIGKILELCLY
jgi:hypothetical protein